MLPAAILLVAAAWAPQEEMPPAAPPPAVRELELRFEGNTAFSEAALREAATDELADLPRYGYRRAEIDDAAFAMEAYYLSQGFPLARVTYEYALTDGLLVALFRVREGPRTVIESITVTGAKIFGPEQLQPFFLAEPGAEIGRDAWYVAGRVEGVPSAVRNLYYFQGYLDAQVAEPEVVFSEDRQRVRIRLSIQEGIHYRVTRIEFSGNAAIGTPELQKAAAGLLGASFFPRKALELRTLVEDLYAEQGYADAQIEVERQPGAAEGAVVLAVALTEGLQVRIGAVQVTGNEKTTDSFIRSRVSLERGDLYRRSQEQASFRALFATGIFKVIEFSLEGRGPVRNLLVTVEEGPSLQVDLTAGYGSYEKLRGGATFRDINLFGTGRILRTTVTGSLVGYSATVGITDPWFLGTDFSLDVPVYILQRREPSYTRREAGVAAYFTRQWTESFSTSLSYQLRLQNATNVQVLVAALAPPGSLRVASVALEPRHDTRNDWFNPTQGHVGSLRMEFGADFLGSELEFFRFVASFFQYFELGEDTVLAAGVRSAFISPRRGTNVIPIEERFINGGEDTVRSFREGKLGPLGITGEPLGGEVRNIVNLELRQRLIGNLYGGLFVDFGNVGLRFQDYFEDFRSGVGVGLRYLLPVGAVRLDVGVNPDTRPGEARAVLQLSVGMAF